MDYYASKELIEYCKNIVKNPDVIMDLYDQSFSWASDKAVKMLGFSHEELANTRIMDLRVKDKSDQEDLIEHTRKKDYVDIFPMKTKSGKVINIQARVVMIEFKNNPYQIVKVKKVVSNKN